MPVERYLQASRGQVSWGDESTTYEVAATTTNWFGLTNEDITPPMPNPYTPLSSGGTRRGPHALSADEKEYSFDVPFLVVDENAPFHVALGAVASQAVDPDLTPASGDEYTEYLFTEEDRLPTLTVAHAQRDAGLLTKYIGCKASLNLTCSKGEHLKATLSFMGVSYDVDTSPGSYDDISGIPDTTPFRFTHLQEVPITLTADGDEGSEGDSVKDLCTIDSFDIGWDNGLEAVHHCGGRDAYSIVEGESANKYSVTLGVTVTDLDLYLRAAEDKERVDISIPLVRETGTNDTPIDALYIHLYDCVITDAPVPLPAQGRLQADITVQPRNTEIEIRVPA